MVLAEGPHVEPAYVSIRQDRRVQATDNPDGGWQGVYVWELRRLPVVRKALPDHPPCRAVWWRSAACGPSLPQRRSTKRWRWPGANAGEAVGGAPTTGGRLIAVAKGFPGAERNPGSSNTPPCPLGRVTGLRLDVNTPFVERFLTLGFGVQQAEACPIRPPPPRNGSTSTFCCRTFLSFFNGPPPFPLG